MLLVAREMLVGVPGISTPNFIATDKKKEMDHQSRTGSGRRRSSSSQEEDQKTHCLLDPRLKCGEISTNTFEDLNLARYPEGDILNEVKRGAIYKGWNLGLRNPQAKKLSIDSYNSGCVDLHGCVETQGFSCPPTGPVSFSTAMSETYDYLNAPFLPDGFEFTPPAYIMGIKDTGPNSVDGWQTAPNGVMAWKVIQEEKNTSG